MIDNRLINEISGLNQVDFFSITGYNDFNKNPLNYPVIGININIDTQCYPIIGNHKNDLSIFINDYNKCILDAIDEINKTPDDKVIKKLLISNKKLRLDNNQGIMEKLPLFLLNILGKLGYHILIDNISIININDAGINKNSTPPTFKMPEYSIKFSNDKTIPWYKTRQNILNIYASIKILLNLIKNLEDIEKHNHQIFFKKLKNILSSIKIIGNLDFNYYVNYVIIGKEDDNLRGRINIMYGNQKKNIDEWEKTKISNNLNIDLISYENNFHVPMSVSNQNIISSKISKLKVIGNSIYNKGDTVFIDEYNECLIVESFGEYIIYYNSLTDSSNFAYNKDGKIKIFNGDNLISIDNDKLIYKDVILNLRDITIYWKQLQKTQPIKRPSLRRIYNSNKQSINSPPYIDHFVGKYDSSPGYKSNSPMYNPFEQEYKINSPPYIDLGEEYSDWSPTYSNTSSDLEVNNPIDNVTPPKKKKRRKKQKEREIKKKVKPYII